MVAAEMESAIKQWPESPMALFKRCLNKIQNILTGALEVNELLGTTQNLWFAAGNSTKVARTIDTNRQRARSTERVNVDQNRILLCGVSHGNAGGTGCASDANAG